MQIEAQRTNIFEKLFDLIKTSHPELLENIVGKNDYLLEEAAIANFIEDLKQKNHPIVKELDGVGLIDYYKSVLHLINLKSNETI